MAIKNKAAVEAEKDKPNVKLGALKTKDEFAATLREVLNSEEGAQLVHLVHAQHKNSGADEDGLGAYIYDLVLAGFEKMGEVALASK